MAHSLEVKVVPSSGKLAIIVDKSGTIKCYLKSAPERGAANKELIKMIAKRVGVTQQAVTIIAGATSRKKILKIESGLTKQELLETLGVHMQLGIF